MTTKLRTLTLLASFGLAVLIVAGCSGCATQIGDLKLPEISATSIEYKRTDPVGGTRITAIGVEDKGDRITADELKVQVTYPAITLDVVVKDYVRRKEPAKTSP